MPHNYIASYRMLGKVQAFTVRAADIYAAHEQAKAQLGVSLGVCVTMPEACQAGTCACAKEGVADGVHPR